MIIRTLELVPYLFWTKNWNIKLDTLLNNEYYICVCMPVSDMDFGTGICVCIIPDTK